MNNATAAGLLGGEVTAEVTSNACRFDVHHGDLSSRLMIEVTTVHLPWSAHCGPGQMPLKAIGNEAVGCGGIDGAEHWQRVAGRVRDQAFTVEMRTSGASDALAEKTRKAAEQVAGILF